MKRIIFSAAMAIVVSISTAASALDSNALIGKWSLVENALDGNGNACPFVSIQVEFTSSGKMLSAEMPSVSLIKSIAFPS